jgi:hypothetical protein
VTRRNRQATKEWVDAFLPLLQRSIHALQDERTETLLRVKSLQERVVEIDRDLKVMEEERERRITLPREMRETEVIPDFPDLPESEYDGPMIETSVDEEIVHQDFFDNSMFAEPGHAIFGHFPGIHAPHKTHAYKEATLRIVRDWVAQWGHDWFSVKDVVRDTQFSPGVIFKRLKDLQEKDAVEHNGKARGGSKWKYNENFPKGPTHRPRSDSPSHRKVAGDPVPHTRAEGASPGKPGLTKKRREQGKRIKSTHK